MCVTLLFRVINLKKMSGQSISVALWWRAAVQQMGIYLLNRETGNRK